MQQRNNVRQTWFFEGYDSFEVERFAAMKCNLIKLLRVYVEIINTVNVKEFRVDE